MNECDSAGHQGYYAFLSFDSNLRLQAQKARPIHIHSSDYTLYNYIIFNLYFTAVERILQYTARGLTD